MVGQKKAWDQKIFRKFLRSHCLGLHIVKYTNYEKVVGRHYTKITSEEYLKALKLVGRPAIRPEGVYMMGWRWLY